MRNTDPDRVFDGLLVQQYLDGDHKAMELLIKRWNKRIVSYAFKMTRNTDNAKDIAQEVWLVAIKSLSKIKEPSKVGSWLLSITHNKCMDVARKNLTIDTLAEFPEKIDSSEMMEQQQNQIIKLRKAIRSMNDTHRTVLTLYYLEGMSIIEISQILSISTGTVKSRLFHAREQLKKVIK